MRVAQHTGSPELRLPARGACAPLGNSGVWALAVCMQVVNASQRSEITGK